MRSFILFILAAAVGIPYAQAQQYPNIYRPPGQHWQELSTPHFRIIYPLGEDSSAYRSARILEGQLPKARRIAGGSLQDFPVILNRDNDMTNGFVSTWPFRSEIELPPPKGKTLNPQSGTWLETVLPHELTHALHFSHLKGLWANTLGLFSPDAARSLHGMVPLGVHEGLATYHESTGVRPGGGRGNYPYFTGQFESVFSSNDRWSMGQMLHTSTYSRPFDRHYLGGYAFTDWLHRTYGEETTSQALDFYIRWPFLGYGTALRHVTGLWPGKLYSRFEADRDSALPAPQSGYAPLPIGLNGAEIRRPVWLSPDELLVYGRFYNGNTGFYRYHLADSSLQKTVETQSVQDYQSDLHPDGTTLLYANYRPSTYYTDTYTMELYEGDLMSGSTQRLTDGLRGYAPAYVDSGDVYAVRTDHSSASLVRLERRGDSLAVTDEIRVPNTRFVAVKPDPSDPGRLAVVANRLGRQGLWVIRTDEVRPRVAGPPDIGFENGSVFDPAWHPSGDYLLFSSDQSGTLQLYEYHPLEQTVNRLTEARFNAMEGSYSPSGERIAFVVQHGNERLPVVIDRKGLAEEAVPPALWNNHGTAGEEPKRLPLFSGDSTLNKEEWKTGPYRPGMRWIRPRTVLPLYREVSNSGSYRAGVSFTGGDHLLRNSYRLGTSYFKDRLWYDLSYRHSGFFPGFTLAGYDRPSFVTYRLQDPNGGTETLRLLRESRGASLGIPARFLLENNVRFTSLSVNPSLEIRGRRLFEPDRTDNPVSRFSTEVSGNLYTVLNYRLRRNTRDPQPHSGLILFSELDHAFHSTSTTVETSDYLLDLSRDNPTSWRTGLYLYAAPLRRLNQSLRIGIEGLTQTSLNIDNQSLVSGAFSEPVFPASHHLLSFTTRYTVPLLFADNGWLLPPLYLGNLYLVGFSNTVSDLEANSLSDFPAGSRTVFGVGVRTRFRISNLNLDIGFAIGYEPSRNTWNPYAGAF